MFANTFGAVFRIRRNMAIYPSLSANKFFLFPYADYYGLPTVEERRTNVPGHYHEPCMI